MMTKQPPMTTNFDARMSGCIVTAAMIGGLFKLNPEKLHFIAECDKLDFQGLDPAVGILADATRKATYRMEKVGSRQFQWSGILDPWLALLEYTCCVAPNLEVLELDLPWVQLRHDQLPTLDRLEAYLDDLKLLPEWIKNNRLLSGIPKTCRFILRHHFFFSPNFKDQLVHRLEEYTEGLKYEEANDPLVIYMVRKGNIDMQLCL